MCVCVSPAFPWASCQRRNAGTDAIKTGCSRGRKRLQVSSGCSGGRSCEFPGRERNFSSALQLHCSEHKKGSGPGEHVLAFFGLFVFFYLVGMFVWYLETRWMWYYFFKVCPFFFGRAVCFMFGNLRFWKECNTFFEMKFDKNVITE